MNLQAEYEIQEDEKKKKEGFWEFIGEKDLYEKLEEMGNSKKEIDRYQKSRLVQSLVVFVILSIAALFFAEWLFIVAIIASFMVFKMKYRGVKQMHNVWKFHRHLQFSKFTRLLIPYLKQSEGDVALYSIFNKILQRTEKEEDRASLYKLMTEMTDDPSSIQPFTDFAERSSGSDMSVLFMSTVFDFQQSTHDTTVIDELGQLASEELIGGIDEIIEFKLRRFVFFPTKIVMSSFIIVIGFAAAVLYFNIQAMDFLGGF